MRQLHRLVDLGFAELTRYIRMLDSMLATCLLAEYPIEALQAELDAWPHYHNHERPHPG